MPVSTEVPQMATAPSPATFRQRYGCDVALLALAALSLLMACIKTSRKKTFWTDEIFSWKVITDSSLAHAIAALKRGADGGTPLYYLLARPWAAIFGSGTLALRLCTSLTLAAALVVLWVTLRRWYSLRATALGALTVFCASNTLLFQNAEARFYGIYVLAAALVLLVMERAAGASRTTPRLLAGVFLANLALVMSHIFGVLYSGLALLALLLIDLRARRRRWRLYAAVLAAWLALLPWKSAIAANADIGVPHNWITQPNAIAWALTYNFNLGFLGPILLALIILTWAETRAASTEEKQAYAGQDASPGRHSLFLFACAFLLAPVILALVSYIGPRVYLERYLLPTMLGIAILLTQLASRTPLAHARGPALRAGWGLLLLALLLAPIGYARYSPFGTLPHVIVELVVPDNLPVVAEDMHEFLEMSYYTRRPGRPYYYILDWDPAMDDRAAVRATQDFKLMRNWRASGYWSDRILTTREFLCRYRQFAIFESENFRWVEWRLANNPNYRIVDEGTAPGVYRSDNHILIVTRLGEHCD